MPELIVLLKRLLKSFLPFKLDKWTFQDEQKCDMENLGMPYYKDSPIIDISLIVHKS